MQKCSEIKAMSYAERLNTILSLRLLRNTTEELSAHTGIQLRNNNFNKKAPFITRCIYSEFCREAKERTGLDLEELLAYYAATSRYFERITKTRKAQPEFYRQVLRCQLDPRFAGSDAAKPYRTESNEAAQFDPAILTLLVLRILPTFKTRMGDIQPDALAEQLRQVRDFFAELYRDSRLMRFAPYLTEEYRNRARRLRGGELFSRIDLIDFAVEIIANLRNNYDPEQLLQANAYLNACKVHPELGGEWWIERDYRSECPVYWRFEPLGADYIAIRQQFDGKTRRMTETRYELFLYQKDEDITFVLMRQSAMEPLCAGGLIPEEAYMQGICRIDDPDRPTELEWEFRTNRYDDFPTVLTRAYGEAEKWSGEMADRTWTVYCETGHYDYMATERVITLQNIYVECDSEPLAEGGRRVTAWYRIPRQGLLTQVGVDSPIVRVRHNETIYIGFIPQNCFLDVTDETRRQREGIDIREQIVVHAEEQPTEAE